MKIVHASRQIGKTTHLIKLSAKEGIPIVCANYPQLNSIKGLAHKLGLDIPQPILASRLMEPGVLTPYKVLIDDLEWVLNTILKTTVVEATTSSDIESLNKEELKTYDGVL